LHHFSRGGTFNRRAQRVGRGSDHADPAARSDSCERHVQRPPTGIRGAFLVGTSGWSYDWERFYPTALASRDRLAFYARCFRSVEVNYSFYHLPRPGTYEKWLSQTPQGFVFALKLSRFITHVRRLEQARTALQTFLSSAAALAQKLGPVLVQLPPTLRADAGVLRAFLQDAHCVAKALSMQDRLRLAFEFRHSSWFESAAVLKQLETFDAALVLAHSRRYPYPTLEPLTARWVYLRFHGPKALFASRYGTQGLAPWVLKIRRWLRQGRDVYGYFNNDVHGYAVDDARALLELVAARAGRARRPVLRPSA
jgi:uncharacterized protein YecE (DUF72 family)